MNESGTDEMFERQDVCMIDRVNEEKESLS